MATQSAEEAIRARPVPVRRRGRAPTGASAGVVLGILLLAIPFSALVSRTLDDAVLIRDMSGYPRWTSEGRLSLLTSVIFLMLAVLAAQRSSLSARRQLTGVTLLAMALSIWLLVSAVLRDSWSPTLALGVGAAVGLFSAVGGLRRTKLRVVPAVLALALTSVWLFALSQPAQAYLPCRVDKCGPQGTLLVGYFPHENYLAFFVAALIPSLLYLRTWVARLVLFYGAAATVTATGSRAALLMLMLAGMVLISKGRAVTFFARWAPITALVVSLVVFLYATGSDLTGRGQIYVAIQERLDGLDAAIGPGEETLKSAFLRGDLTFLPAHEHGQAPYLLTHAGFIGLALFAALLVALAKVKDVQGHGRDYRVGRGMLTVASGAFATESLVKAQAMDPFFWILFAVVLLVSAAPSANGFSEPT